MSEKTLKYNNIRLNKKGFRKSKKLSDLVSVDVDQIVLSDKLKHNNEGFKYFTGYYEIYSMFIQAFFFFFASLEAKKLPHLQSSFLFDILLLRYYLF